MNNDIRRIVEENWEDIKALVIEKAEAEQKLKTIWDLGTKDNEEYYYICPDGDIGWVVFNSCYDEKARDIGNAFLNEEEARFERERRKVEAIMRKYSRPFKNNRDNYCLHFYNCISICAGYNTAYNYGVPCFETKEIAQKVIDEIGEDRLKKYWFGVTE